MEKRWKSILTLTLTTFMLSLVLNLGSNSVLSFLPLTLSLTLLLFIIFIGVVFDIIGVATTAGDEAPLHAMASNRIPGAKQGIWLVRHADAVATFCNDLIGDVAGTLSGAVGVAVVFQLKSFSLGFGEALATTIVVALIAALTVGGKALGKTFAISNSTTIVLMAGRMLYSLERIKIRFNSSPGKKRKR